jgi:hypothetical protein
VVNPGRTIKTLVPRLAICDRMVALAPSPIATIAMTAPTPMMIPSMVRKDLSLFLRSARRAILKVMSHTVASGEWQMSNYKFEFCSFHFAFCNLQLTL